MSEYTRPDAAAADVTWRTLTNENSTTLSGKVDVGENAPDRIFIFDWDSGELQASITPNANGEWSTLVVRGTQFGITYIKEGCNPITEGKYNAI